MNLQWNETEQEEERKGNGKLMIQYNQKKQFREKSDNANKIKKKAYQNKTNKTNKNNKRKQG